MSLFWRAETWHILLRISVRLSPKSQAIGSPIVCCSKLLFRYIPLHTRSLLYPQTAVAHSYGLFLRRSKHPHILLNLLNVRSYSCVIFCSFPWFSLWDILCFFGDMWGSDGMWRLPVCVLNYTEGITTENHNIDMFISLNFIIL